MTMTAPRYRVVDDGTDEAQWLEARRPFIGASQGAALLGLSPYSTALDVWNSMQPGAEPIQENRFMTWGKRMESVVADWTEVDYPHIGKLLPSPGLLASIDYPFLAATPDRMNEIDGRVRSLTELKTGSEYTKSNWFEEFTGAPDQPIYYETQVQQQLFVSGFATGWLVPLIGGNDLLEPRLITLNQEYVDIMLREFADWYEAYVVKEIPPPATRFDDLKTMFRGSPKGVSNMVDATPEVMRKVRTRNKLQPRLSAGKKWDDELKGDIQAFMGDHTELVDPDSGRVVVTWYQGVKPTQKLDVASLALAHPDLYAQYLTSKEAGRTMQFPKK